MLYVNEDIKRKYAKETTLRAKAESLSGRIVIREYVNGNSRDIPRSASKKEKDILYK